VYVENDIDIRNLPLLKEEMIKELIPSVGHRARFVSNLDDWRVIVSAMPNTSNESNTVITIFLCTISQPYYQVSTTTYF
jgi:hypothetical protein